MGETDHTAEQFARVSDFVSYADGDLDKQFQSIRIL
jgi:hypothetical protein